MDVPDERVVRTKFDIYVGFYYKYGQIKIVISLKCSLYNPMYDILTDLYMYIALLYKTLSIYLEKSME